VVMQQAMVGSGRRLGSVERRPPAACGGGARGLAASDGPAAPPRAFGLALRESA